MFNKNKNKNKNKTTIVPLKFSIFAAATAAALRRSSIQSWRSAAGAAVVVAASRIAKFYSKGTERNCCEVAELARGVGGREAPSSKSVCLSETK